MIIKQSKLLSVLAEKSRYYNNLLKEAKDEAEGQEPEQNEDENAGQNDGDPFASPEGGGDTPPDMGGLGEDPGMGMDPTQTPDVGDTPNNEAGEYISDTKLAMYATTLLKAYQAKPTKIPSELMNVTVQNAAQVIKYIEDCVQLDEPTNEIASDLTKI
jgi:hypothetical protein